mmetsp:Transcript_17841/g.42249  ORF Transcript_17841/g.42249 Transcript_17841/m.42249 type:complete len:252 (-) Transcript_17841:50-805(-)|eukprot:CAMPEP_0179934890 /NCGR_PEP_ID=MMETSP0983-20121128/12748_1 /TAXON_ID=483367 /ORGANISM="non described non described, Strain CCMP 2436" /LENGTH=251 /DNA_ID=CAMNT_0021840003 /DNA_START=101 /DNA_END=856 /DNA_ORIENTATION=+
MGARLLLLLAAPASGMAHSLSKRIGSHMIFEIWGVSAATLNDANFLESALRRASHAASLNVLEAAFHLFEPQGVTGMLILSESHLSVHTWPELGYAAIDLFSCGAPSSLPCSEASSSGEVTMHMSSEQTAGQPPAPLARWTCADGSRATVPNRHYAESIALGDADPRSLTPAGKEPSDLWAGVESLVNDLRPANVHLRRFERGVPGSAAIPGHGANTPAGVAFMIAMVAAVAATLLARENRRRKMAYRAPC